MVKLAYRNLWVLALWLFCATYARAQAVVSSVKTFPEIPGGGIALAQIFDTKVIDPLQYTAHKAKFYYIWGASAPAQPAGVLASKYLPSIRTPDRKLTVDWYRQNHPDWVMYQEDKTTPAYGYIYDYGGLTPLDVANPEARAFYLKEFILPAVKSGYRMVAMDNVDLANWPKAAGHFNGKEWVETYTGKKNDAAFQQAMINWMQYLSTQLHPLGVRVSANIKSTSAPEDIVLKVINAVDMWVDETGFCHRGEKITGEGWKKAFSLLRKVAPTKAYVSINQVKGEVATASHDQVEWIVANYLLARGPQSLLAVAGYGKSTIYHHFDYRPEYDVPIGEPTGNPQEGEGGVWKRAYTGGLVFVNPSADHAASITLPPGKWQTADGHAIAGTIDMPPATGWVCISQNTSH